MIAMSAFRQIDEIAGTNPGTPIAQSIQRFGENAIVLKWRNSPDSPGIAPIPGSARPGVPPPAATPSQRT